MKKIKLMIDIAELELNEEDKKKSPVEMSAIVIHNAVYTYSQQNRGLTKEERGQYYTLDFELDKAKKDNLEEIEVDDKICGFVRKCFRESKLTPTKLLQKVEQNIDNIEGYK
jgi:hypothetical protein